MKIAQYALNRPTVMYFLTIMIVAGGIISYQKLGRLQDPEFTIKQAVILTQYPGATAQEVEEEITDRLETAIQQLKQLDKVTSISQSGLSIIYAEMKDTYDGKELPQVWDELRRKVNAAAARLPQGAYPPFVNDDFGDVYGIFFAITGDGYEYKELQDYADLLRKELLLCEDVAKVETWGEQQETIYVELSRSKIASLGIPIQVIFNLLNQQNLVSPSGKVHAGDDYIPIRTSGNIDSVEAIENLLIPGLDSSKLIRLKDVARVKRGYIDPPTRLLKFNGKQGIGIGISTVPGGNVITMGESVKAKLAELESSTPEGMELNVVSLQADTVKEAIDGFVLNLVEALIIVIVLLVVFMGWREGLLIGLVLLLTILATFIFMRIMDVNLQSISLGALIIALGMLVDNAIVVAEGIVIKLHRGKTREQAAVETIEETKWPLLGATIIAILAFAAISLSPDATGEFLGSLFSVVAVSLLLSWVIAVTITPLLCVKFLPAEKGGDKDPHDTWFYRLYGNFLHGCIRFRWVTILVVIAILFGAFQGFKYIDNIFFPASTRDQFLVDIWMPEGTHIETTSKKVDELAAHLRTVDGVTDTSSFVGGGALRFLLSYSPQMSNTSYGQVIVSVEDYNLIDGMIPELSNYLEEAFPQALTDIRRFEFGPPGGKIEVRFSGPELATLRRLADEAKAVMASFDDAHLIRDDWRQRTKSIQLTMNESAARNAGITRSDVNRTLEMVYSGVNVGLYREGEEMLPIKVRAPLEERDEPEDINGVQVMSSATGRMVPIGQVVQSITPEWEEPVIQRRNRKRTVTAQCNPIYKTAHSLFVEMKPGLEAIELPDGYEMEWGGEYERSTRAQKKLMANVPLAFMLMLFISIMLFNSFRHALIIFLGLPLAIIGVTIGLLAFQAPFGFMSLLGFLSLSGMLIKNEIVLLDQIEIEIRSGKERFEAIIDSAISRVRPVCMAAFTTVLGMIPLVLDATFSGMAVTIIGGLSFATLLTLVVLPVLYATVFRIHPKEKVHA